MSSTGNIFSVHNNEINASCEIELIENPDDDQIKYIVEKWYPVLQNTHAQAVLFLKSLPREQKRIDVWQKIQSQYVVQDAHWDWRAKKNTMLNSSHRMYALRYRDSIEAIMRIDLSNFSQIVKSPITHIVYIDYLAVAPWNRSAIQQPPRFKGLGSILLGVAVSISIEEEMDGRCGLHSLPQSEGFYIQKGMKDMGLVDNQNLKYFEFEPAEAKTFLNN